jgi:homoserine kinase
LRATAFAPGSVGNVGPGFDVLGLAVDGAGDRVTVELTRGESTVEVSGRDSGAIPTDPAKNSASIAANALLAPHGLRAIVHVEKGLALAGGMGGSAASAVAGAYAASLALGLAPTMEAVIAAALEGEAAVAGRHLDNIASSALGGLTLSRSVDPIDCIRLPVAARWFVVRVTPAIRIRTEDARALLPAMVERSLMIEQMANTAALMHAFATGDADLLSRALDDRFAEPRRAPLIPNFFLVKSAAIEAGALGCSISGAGPSVFAIARDEPSAQRCAEAMHRAFGIASATHIGPIATEGVRKVSE